MPSCLPRCLPTVLVRTVRLAAYTGIWLYAVAPSRGDAAESRRNAIVMAVEGVRESVVNIHGQKTLTPGDDPLARVEARRVNGMGTGVVIDERGYIITNFHVVDGVKNIEVTLANGDTCVAELVSNDPVSDLAIIKVDLPEKLPAIRMGTSDDLMIGESVIAVGNAYGYEHTVTRGIISALHRKVQVTDTQNYDDLIQTDASINPGNSGGPLLNIDGEMIGINVAVRAGALGIGFAIPIDKAMASAATLMSAQRVERKWHGVTSSDTPGRLDGAVVTAIDDDSPAAKCGLKRGDVITGVEGQNVARALDFERALLGRPIGEDVMVTVRRNNHPVQLNLAMAPRPQRAKASADDAWEILGLRLQPMPSQDFRQFRSRYRGGLSVTSVRSDGPAAKQGIRRGDVLVGMHIWETVSLDNVEYILNRQDFAEFEPVKFYILRGNETLYGHIPVALERSTTKSE